MKIGTIEKLTLKDGSSSYRATIQRDYNSFRATFKVEAEAEQWLKSMNRKYQKKRIQKQFESFEKMSLSPEDDNCLGSRVSALEECVKSGAKELSDQRDKIQKIARLFKQL